MKVEETVISSNDEIKKVVIRKNTLRLFSFIIFEPVFLSSG